MNTKFYISALATGLMCLVCTTDANAMGGLFHGGCGCDTGCSTGCGPDYFTSNVCRPRIGSRLSSMFCKSSCGVSVASCGCDAAPSCGCDSYCAPEPCCNRPVLGYHIRKAIKLRSRCNVAPSCGCDMAPSCGCDMAPSCGCDMGPVCDPCAPKCGPKFGHRIKNLFNRCKPACGCDMAPSCGCDMAPSCGCGY